MDFMFGPLNVSIYNKSAEISSFLLLWVAFNKADLLYLVTNMYIDEYC